MGIAVIQLRRDATGSATYQGPAAGRYAVYEPDTGDSGIGSFTASATLQADFDATPNNTVSGMITGFSNDPSWSLALKQRNHQLAATLETTGPLRTILAMTSHLDDRRRSRR